MNNNSHHNEKAIIQLLFEAFAHFDMLFKFGRYWFTRCTFGDPYDFHQNSRLQSAAIFKAILEYESVILHSRGGGLHHPVIIIAAKLACHKLSLKYKLRLYYEIICSMSVVNKMYFKRFLKTD